MQIWLHDCVFICKINVWVFATENLIASLLENLQKWKNVQRFWVFSIHLPIYTLDNNRSWNVPSANPFGSLNRSPNRIARYRHAWNSLCKRFLIASDNDNIRKSQIRSGAFSSSNPAVDWFHVGYCAIDYSICL